MIITLATVAWRATPHRIRTTGYLSSGSSQCFDWLLEACNGGDHYHLALDTRALARVVGSELEAQGYHCEDSQGARQVAQGAFEDDINAAQRRQYGGHLAKALADEVIRALRKRLPRSTIGDPNTGRTVLTVDVEVARGAMQWPKMR